MYDLLSLKNRFLPRQILRVVLMALGTCILLVGRGCATIRVTDPPRTASEEFLENVATASAIDQISANVLRDRKVYIETTYLTASTQPSDEHQYLLGELRAKLLLAGVRIVTKKEDAQIIMEVRSQGISIDRTEFLLGIPSSTVGGLVTGGVAATTPELSIVKTTKQHGFASVAYIAYWADTGEVVSSSGPVVGRTYRDDYWFLGLGPNTSGNIPPTDAEIKAQKSTDKPNEKPMKPMEKYKGKGPTAK